MSSARGEEPQLPADRSLPPGQHLVGEPPIMHYGPLPRATGREWTFTVGGATASGVESVLSMAQILRLPPLEIDADMHCGTHWSALDQRWAGVSAAALVRRVPPAPGVRHALVFAEYGYAANVHLDDLVSPRSVLATHWNGDPLAIERGAPLRLVIPQLYTWKGPKWIRGWNYLREGEVQLGFWEERGYHARGDAWREQRYSYQD